VLKAGLPDGIFFQTKNPNLGKFWRVLQWKMLVYFTVIWYIGIVAIGYICWLFGIFVGYLVYLLVIWYICWLFWYIFPFWYVEEREIWQPWLKAATQSAYLQLDFFKM
jgi:hypothetical protein